MKQQEQTAKRLSVRRSAMPLGQDHDWSRDSVHDAERKPEEQFPARQPTAKKDGITRKHAAPAREHGAIHENSLT
jgi:hypothetical protein